MEIKSIDKSNEEENEDNWSVPVFKEHVSKLAKI